jgi:hypothetical protein
MALIPSKARAGTFAAALATFVTPSAANDATLLLQRQTQGVDD